MNDDNVKIIGAGLAGTLMAILLARRGHTVNLYERRPDLRREVVPEGRSINLAMAARGIRALDAAGVMKQVGSLLIPIPGRMLHAIDGKLTFVPYGQRKHEVTYSVSRSGLSKILLDAAEAAGVTIHFGQSAMSVELRQGHIAMRFDDSRASASDGHWKLAMHRVIGADGAGSPLRRSLVAASGARCSENLLKHGYKELRLPPNAKGQYQLEKNALHIWPHGGFMLIALPNLDGSFTLTLFLPLEGAESFDTLQSAHDVERFFSHYFPDVHALLPDLAAEFFEHPTGLMGTVRCEQWSVGDRLLLIGDAAHAITPFHGQGMNCAFEDCTELDALLQAQPDWAQAFAAFEQSRRPNTNAIADMAIENYIEMRDTVREPKFQLQKALSLELERRFPDRFVPRYSMVMFHDDIPYSVAFERGRIQQEILALLTREANSLQEVDYAAAATLIEQRLASL
jgi:kynurenine 3-monooxygenase